MLVVVCIYLLVATIGYFKPGPGEKDRQVYAWVSSNYELGLLAAKGYNLSAVGITTSVQLKNCQVYIMAPPVYHILLTGVYAISGQNWRALRLGPIFFGLVFLYACLALAVKFFQGQQRNWLLFFALTPMVLIFSVWNDLRGTTMGIVIISYLCLVNYLETGELRWVIWSAVFFLLAFWIDYMAFSIVPAMLLQVLLHPGLTSRERVVGFSILVGSIGLAALAAFAHFATLPGGVDWFITRFAERYSNRRPEISGGTYSILDFISRQSIRFVTHFTPISIILAGWAFLAAIYKLMRRKLVSEAYNGYVKVNPYIALLVFFTWGVPSQLGIQVAYIHPLFMYYFITFFAFAPVVGLDLISEKMRTLPTKKIFITAVLAGFMLISVVRSVFNLTGGSLYDMATGVKTPPAEIYTIEQLQQYTCRSWMLK